MTTPTRPPMTSPFSPLTEDEIEIVTAFRDEPVAQRSAEEIDRAATRFASATREHAIARKRRRRAKGSLVGAALVVGALVAFLAGRFWPTPSAPAPLTPSVHAAWDEETLFWEAVAASRAGKTLDARARLEAFVAQFPRSAHRFEAMNILGWERLAAGDVNGARGAFEQARNSDDPRVSENAARGLAGIDAD